MNSRIRKVLFSLTAVACMAALPAGLPAAPVGTGFTYQGHLGDGGQPAQGAYDFQFKLWDAATNGAAVGSTVTLNDVAVSEGLFTVTLDFGSTAINGEARWLEIGVRPGASADPYTLLTPRQPVTAAPYALYSLNGSLWKAVGSAITNTNTGFVGINRSSTVSAAEYFGIQAPVDSGYGGMYIRTNGASGQPFYGYAVPGTSSWTYLDGPSGDWALHHGGSDRITVTPDGDVGIGDTTPTARLDVATDTGYAIDASSSAAFSYGVRGTGLSAGVRGECGTSSGAGVYGVNNTTGGTGVRGDTSASGASGVAGYGNLGTGVYGQSTGGGYGIYGTNGGSNSNGYAGYFNGRVHVAGALSKSSGSFKIDHPLDPLNKTLSHSFVESPDMMNIYNGIAVLGADGRAVVTMPSYFEALNREFRYQLTAVGAAMPALHVAREIDNNAFVIAGGQPNAKVSWQVTGVRQDPWAEAHRIKVEEDKPDRERGQYLNPDVYGAGPAASSSTDSAARGG